MKLQEILIKNQKSKIKVSDALFDGNYPFFTSGEKQKRLDEYLCDGKNIYIATGGKANFKYYEGKASYSTDCISLKTSELADTKYIFYFLLSKKEQINKEMFLGAALKHLQKKQFENIEITLPPLPEQKRIVTKLDKAFSEIDNSIKNTSKLNSLTQKLFLKSLNFYMNLQEDGEKIPLGNACELSQGLAINKTTKHLLVERSSKPLLRIKDLINNNEIQYIDETYSNAKTEVNEKDLIFTRTGSLGLVFTGRKGVLHNNSFSVRPKNILLNEYLFWWLKNPEFLNEIHRIAKKAAQPDISHKLFNAQLIRIPSIKKQHTIVKVIKTLNELIESYQNICERKLRNLLQLKYAMLQKELKSEAV